MTAGKPVTTVHGGIATAKTKNCGNRFRARAAAGHCRRRENIDTAADRSWSWPGITENGTATATAVMGNSLRRNKDV